MTKGITFGKADEELIKAIEAYQHKNEISSFVEAVRKLCRMALEIEKIRSKEE